MSSGTDTLLKVENSARNARWIFPDICEDTAARMMQVNNIPEILARLLSARDVAVEGVEEFLYPRLSRHFPDPFTLKDMDAFAPWLAQAIIDQRTIAIFGDFDVDGSTSAALLKRFLGYYGIDAPIYIPDRMEEGYGPNVNALASLKADGADIVLIADCGTTSFDVIAQARDLGLDIAVFDHHESEETLPQANYIINPKRRDDESGLDMLAAVGVCFMACVGVNAALRDQLGRHDHLPREAAAMKNWLDLVALGTICDMVPLKGANRLFVRAGLQQMARGDNPGIQALKETAKITESPDPYHCGFLLGPRINAGSRIHKSDLGARLLSARDAEEAKDIAWMLHDCNEKRKNIQAQMLDQAKGIIEARGLDQHAVLFVDMPDGHAGLSGLVAGQLKEKYRKPAVVVTYVPAGDSDMEGRGSGRSVEGVNMAAAFIDARNEGLLIKGGGHAMAGGFTIDLDRLDDFHAFLNTHIENQLAGAPVPNDTRVDGVITVRGAQPGFVKLIHENVGPFGMENPEPLFVLANVRVHMADIVGKNHVRCMISDWEGGSRLKAIAFKAADTQVGRLILQGDTRPLHIAGTLKLDTWNGQERVEMHIQDAALATTGEGEVKNLRSA